MAPDTIIRLEKATIAHPDNVVLTNVDLEINSGEFVYLIGRTGTGKSTLLKTLYAELPLLKGEGFVAGFDLQRLKNKKVPFLRRKLGIIFQDFQLLTDRSVYENLFFVLKATGWKKKTEMDKRIRDVLEKVGLGFKEYKMPHELSGGEQQRVVIARALLNDPEVILADEPTGNLDPESSSGIINLLMDISKNGRAVVVATHDYPLLKQFPARTIKCENSSLIEMQSDEQEVIDFDKL
ncbi:MAG TPA: phosphonate ABC transporter ATP-binding protein [Marinilabiliales bacterium]|jgi:cell division transport system ATP-binding protein|nr:MAG: phosphonate ABC transporter ATP-binding protein [Bacteroidetes bacterium GWA2_40_14]OFX65708.1 MAG: phosphonate ABC transporter ATP-binding protein [Bacteroidetes bacterium GWC2_40_13]OFX75962.1 MAG: phosphonate ABC transporter ATP-binding protein [Bacteroidetes bacterium GWD2_40_43]OFX94424.1 MAG: phosphonate ABC transporter ATP-binding protein [Bacteroidetes bacterium GWE2_40_63]OFY18901.1 MAG: phosphonate ABC transporter ATP-binding protein [Bacteroidetes bacterium GWF2_40_13]OFZ288